ncbi:hypothetical protein PPL_07321 [Heterostelium album PN500]|uniref:Uncharacterized protein n=1 Tax=Heterostelium pallidum (strain ATCC 26659 / Pp 5 / PN500) TaxID=670386 RepID=D3BF05_HETP5|nr:hypothetical protein PPL_07321 [Heterostelium album PN500]EFA80486.1 hypothetical protein PPL_07321 [Heterostelium album PN500]|eukprot:XP_020432606.1 hypothetical protein PPL_07321 [Heterostelium album PN500]
MKLTFILHEEILNYIFQSSHIPIKNWVGVNNRNLYFPLTWKLTLALVCKRWSVVVDRLYFKYTSYLDVHFGSTDFMVSTLNHVRNTGMKYHPANEGEGQLHFYDIEIPYPTNCIVSFKMTITTDIADQIAIYNRQVDRLIELLDSESLENINSLYIFNFPEEYPANTLYRVYSIQSLAKSLRFDFADDMKTNESTIRSLNETLATNNKITSFKITYFEDFPLPLTINIGSIKKLAMQTFNNLDAGHLEKQSEHSAVEWLDLKYNFKAMLNLPIFTNNLIFKNIRFLSITENSMDDFSFLGSQYCNVEILKLYTIKKIMPSCNIQSLFSNLASNKSVHTFSLDYQISDCPEIKMFVKSNKNIRIIRVNKLCCSTLVDLLNRSKDYSLYRVVKHFHTFCRNVE